METRRKIVRVVRPLSRSRALLLLENVRRQYTSVSSINYGPVLRNCLSRTPRRRKKNNKPDGNGHVIYIYVRARYSSVRRRVVVVVYRNNFIATAWPVRWSIGCARPLYYLRSRTLFRNFLGDDDDDDKCRVRFSSPLRNRFWRAGG